MKYADLHVHTHFSDGTFAPGHLIKEAASAGLSCVAVVDHDTVSGIEAACQAGAQEGIEVVPGIEMSAEYEGSEVHILGYFIDHKSPALLEKLDFLKRNRVERVYKIVEKLQALGLRVPVEKVLRLAPNGTVGRLHVARVLAEEKLVNSLGEAFNRYIGDNGPAYVLGFKFSPQQATQAIDEAGGVPVLAHPYTLHDDALIPTFIKMGIRGLEAYYPEHSNAMTNAYVSIAQKYGLCLTGGSDFHGHAKPLVKVGAMKIPYDLVEALRASRK